MTSKFKLRRTKGRLNNFSRKKVLELIFDNGFYLSDGCSSDEECSEVHSYLGNDELHTQVLNALDRAVTVRATCRSDGDSSNECEDDEVLKILCLLFLQRMRINLVALKKKEENSNCR